VDKFIVDNAKDVEGGWTTMGVETPHDFGYSYTVRPMHCEGDGLPRDVTMPKEPFIKVLTLFHTINLRIISDF
jgi:hypothetical protein